MTKLVEGRAKQATENYIAFMIDNISKEPLEEDETKEERQDNLKYLKDNPQWITEEYFVQIQNKIQKYKLICLKVKT